MTSGRTLPRRTVLRNLAAGGVAAGGIAALGGAGLLAPRWFSGAAAFAATPRALPIPPLLEGTMRDGVRRYDLTLQKGVSRFFDGVETPTLGINGPYLGPTLRMRAGDTVRMNVTNRLGLPSTLHWHGFHLPARADGGPHQVIADGETWSPQFTVKQRAAMFWYHSHMVPRTGVQVYHGLAGLIYVDDAEADALALPRDYGVDDVPLVLQDRAFSRNGALIYGNSMRDMMLGMRGDVLLVNGAPAPHFVARTQKLRLRLLNGSNARFYTIGFSDGRGFQLIGSDGGLLEAPVATTRITLAPAERAQIVVDLADGRPVLLQSFAGGGGGRAGGMGRMMSGGMMGGGRRGGEMDFAILDIRPDANSPPSAPLPARLIALERPDPAAAVRTRRFVLQMGMMGGGIAINGKPMAMDRIDEAVQIGTSEIWEVGNRSMLDHPFHVHDVQFRVLDRNNTPPPPGERGLKDTVVVPAGGRVRLLLRFSDYADPERPYMYHCHILEHEDAGMMGQFVVRA